MFKLQAPFHFKGMMDLTQVKDMQACSSGHPPMDMRTAARSCWGLWSVQRIMAKDGGLVCQARELLSLEGYAAAGERECSVLLLRLGLCMDFIFCSGICLESGAD